MEFIYIHCLASFGLFFAKPNCLMLLSFYSVKITPILKVRCSTPLQHPLTNSFKHTRKIYVVAYKLVSIWFLASHQIYVCAGNNNNSNNNNNNSNNENGFKLNCQMIYCPKFLTTVNIENSDKRSGVKPCCRSKICGN